ncbi:unnamed protein product [Arctia plantaginis]|uniref:Malate dehydrogenase, mitochondrial n=1 Tax=Arctia plantaginis TaxID=874455 RepID=A0A8S0Z6F2_ARCPL|nr:unnamed protein product [Arctia plantaginis]CAB3236016.1 unnamed protein product [Arctia plantaginis]
MFYRKLSASYLFAKQLTACVSAKYSPLRKINVSVIGAANQVGSNLAFLLKQNSQITKLDLHDDDAKVYGIGLELNDLPGGPQINVWSGDNTLDNAVRDSHLVMMVYRVPRRPGNTREQMIAANAPAVKKLCRSIAFQNPGAFLAIATNPLNAIVPFASALLYKYNAYNPFKILGITHLDSVRARTTTAKALGINPLDVSLPVIGGHSDQTIIPLFSNMVPNTNAIDPYQAETLTRIIRKAGTEIVFQKYGKESATLSMAAALNDFINQMKIALSGDEVVVNAYTANPNFGTRFFSGPTKVGPCGIVQTCHSFQLSDYESFLLNSAIPLLNRDVSMGEDYVRYIDFARKS